MLYHSGEQRPPPHAHTMNSELPSSVFPEQTPPDFPENPLRLERSRAAPRQIPEEIESRPREDQFTAYEGLGPDGLPIGTPLLLKLPGVYLQRPPLLVYLQRPPLLVNLGPLVPTPAPLREVLENDRPFKRFRGNSS